VVERDLAKVEVAGSNPVSRSRFYAAPSYWEPFSRIRYCTRPSFRNTPMKSPCAFRAFLSKWL
jgi:hypothetical protein